MTPHSWCPTCNEQWQRVLRVYLIIPLFVSFMAGLLVATTMQAVAAQETEAEYNTAFCKRIDGQAETRHAYTYGTSTGHVFIDCETEYVVYEGGLDKRSSLDSLQQAVFFAWLTGKRPAIVIYDTDGKEGRYEYRIRQAATFFGVLYLRITQDDLE